MTAEKSEVSIAPEAFRHVLGQNPTGVTAITGIDPHGEPIAMIVGTFSSVSLEPQLISFMPMHTSSSFARLLTAETLCANVLSLNQESLCRKLARPGGPEKFEDVEWEPSPGGAPVISGNAAWIEFKISQRIPAGDHDIVIGEVTDLGIGDGGLPLIFLGGGYGRYNAHSRIMPTTADSVQQIRWAEAAKPQLEQLSLQLELEVVFVSIIDDAIVQVASFGSPSSTFRPHPLGVRLPLGAPMGAPVVALASQDAQRRWIERTSPGADEDLMELHFEALNRIRERGWSMNLVPESFQEADLAVLKSESGELIWGQIPLDASLAHPDTYGADLPADPRAELSIRNISVPIRDQDGRPLCYLTLFGFEKTTSLLAVNTIVSRFLETAAEVEATLNTL